MLPIAPKKGRFAASRRVRSLVTVAVLVLAGLAAAQDAGSAGATGSGSGAGTPALTSLVTSTVSPTTAPSPSTTAPAPTTEAPKKTTAPTSTETPEVTEEATEAPTETPTPTKKKKKESTNSSSGETTVTPEPATIAPVATDTPTTTPPATLENDEIASDTTKPSSSLSASLPRSGANYGGKVDSSSSGSATDANTKSSGDAGKNAMQFVMIAVGVMAVVLVVAVSVFYNKKRESDALEAAQEDKYFEKRISVMESGTTTAKASGTVFENYSTPSAAVADLEMDRRQMATALNTQTTAPAPAVQPPSKPVPTYTEFRDSEYEIAEVPVAVKSAAPQPVAKPAPAYNEFRDSEFDAPQPQIGIMTTAATTGASATFLARGNGENDIDGGEEAVSPVEAARKTAAKIRQYMDEDFRSPRSNASPRATVQRLTRCRGNSEAVSDNASSQYGSVINNGLLHEEEEGYKNSMDGAPPAQNYTPSYVPSVRSTDIDVDIDGDIDGDLTDDEEDIVGRDMRTSSMYDITRASDFTVSGEDPRYSRSSSIAEFHDSTSTRFSELDSEEFEV